jgi:hypothetical protein
MLWRKLLRRSDVGTQQGNFTGGVRLTQAKFRTAVGYIDQTTYFRHQLFGHLAWGVGRAKPFREDAWADFSVAIRGQDLGVHSLRITHKPSGEAGQNNYTTTLHWGNLGKTIRPLSLEGTVLTLFAPSRQGEPFSVEIW